MARLRPQPGSTVRQLQPSPSSKKSGEIATGTVLLLPLVPSKLAGLALTGFSSALLTMYWRTPAMHEPGSIWPTRAGTAVSKDVWMLGTGLGLLMSDS